MDYNSDNQQFITEEQRERDVEAEQIPRVRAAEKSIEENNGRYRKSHGIPGLIIAMLSGIVFVLCFSSWTSPIFLGSYGYDSAFFSMVGRAILEGKVMYRDFFDVKGPVFFFWEAFGQLLCRDRGGVFILQCISIVGTTFFIYKLCRLYRLSGKAVLFVYFVFYFIYATTLWGGNSVEEYCLPLTMACIYFGIQFLKGIRKSVSVAFFYGVTFGIMLLSKVTICAPMGAITLVILIYLLNEKRYKDAVSAVVLFVCGLVDVVFPVIAYFYSKGALSDFLLCAFNVAFKRGTDYYEPVSMKWELYLVICYAGFALFIAKIFERSMEKWLLLALTVLTFMALHLGTPFDYYFITTLPLTVFICVLICNDIRRIVKAGLSQKELKIAAVSIAVASMGIAFTCTSYAQKTIDKCKENIEIFKDKREYKYYEQCKEVYEKIPEEDKIDGVYCLESGMIFYEVNQTLPTNRFPINMPYFCNLYPPAEKEILYVINKETPKWLVAEDLDSLDNANIKLAVYNHYEKVYSNSMDELWQRID